MIQRVRWIVQGLLLCVLCATSLGASAEAGNGLISYELVPSSPEPNTAFTLHIVYSPPYFLDYNGTSVSIQNSDIIVTLDLFMAGCPPLLPCDYEVNIPIDGLPSGSYSMHIVDADDDPPLDTAFTFIIGAPASVSVPALSLGMQGLLAIMILLVSLAIGISGRNRKNTA